MTPGLGKDIQYHEWHYCSQEPQSPDQTQGSHVQWTVSLVFVDGHFSLPQGFVWVDKYTYYPWGSYIGYGFEDKFSEFCLKKTSCIIY